MKTNHDYFVHLNLFFSRIHIVYLNIAIHVFIMMMYKAITLVSNVDESWFDTFLLCCFIPSDQQIKEFASSKSASVSHWAT